MSLLELVVQRDGLPSAIAGGAAALNYLVSFSAQAAASATSWG